jgi:hypothetical protein
MILMRSPWRADRPSFDLFESPAAAARALASPAFMILAQARAPITDIRIARGVAVLVADAHRLFIVKIAITHGALVGPRRRPSDESISVTRVVIIVRLSP